MPPEKCSGGFFYIEAHCLDCVLQENCLRPASRRIGDFSSCSPIAQLDRRIQKNQWLNATLLKCCGHASGNSEMIVGGNLALGLSHRHASRAADHGNGQKTVPGANLHRSLPNLRYRQLEPPAVFAIGHAGGNQHAPRTGRRAGRGGDFPFEKNRSGETTAASRGTMRRSANCVGLASTSRKTPHPP